MIGLLASLAVLTGTTPAPPVPDLKTVRMRAYMTGERLEGYCNDPDPQSEGLESCLGYLGGAVDQLLVMDAVSPKPALCLPTDIDLGSLREAYLARLRVHPEGRALPAVLVIDVAVTPTLSCSRLARTAD